MPADPRWADFRRQMPSSDRWAYFDHAAVAPLPAPAGEAITTWVQEAMRGGGTEWLGWKKRREAARAMAAQLVGAKPEEIALVRSTTVGVNLVAEGFLWQPGDNVVAPGDEFPANLYPWMNLANRGVETRRVPSDGLRIDLNRLAEACDARTRIVTLSWVGYASGWRTDLAAAAELAHRHGALLFVDAIQGLGAFPLDVRATGIDFLAAGGQKWLLGPEAAGLFYLRRELIDRLRPTNIGANSVVHAADYSHIELRLRDTADRFEGGASNMVGVTGLAASLELLLALGAEAIGERILAMTDFACRRLSEIGCVVASVRESAEQSSGIVLFDLPGEDPQAVRRRLLEQNIVLSCRAGKLRISPHAYANEADIERLIEALQSCRA
jgi:selenocysteine lyase/cysteine desulfurase